MRMCNAYLGDREKALQPISDYRDRFRGEGTERLPLSKAGVGPSTIRGDNRTHGYDTTHQDNYKGGWQMPAKLVDPVSKHEILYSIITIRIVK